MQPAYVGRAARIVAACFALATCLSLSPAAAQETFDIATFEAPPGWNRVTAPGVLAFQTSGGADQILLFPSFATDASPTENFMADWAKLVKPAIGPVEPGHLDTEQTADGWTAVTGAAEVTRGNSTLVVAQMTATGFGRTISILAQISTQERMAELTRFFDGVQLRIEAPSAPPRLGVQSPTDATPSAQQATRVTPMTIERLPVESAGFVEGRPTGLFYRVSVNTQGSSRLTVETRLFLSQNRIARVFPYGGGDGFSASRCSADTCGTYEIDAANLVTRWDNGQVDRQPWSRTGNGFTLDGTLFRPATSVTESALLGEWSDGGTAGSALAITYTFATNGRVIFGSGTRRIEGRFAVQGTTLILEFEDGTRDRRTLFAASSGEPIGLICIEGDVYARRQVPPSG